MKIKRIAGFFGIFCALIASTALALRAARIETKWSPRGSWEWELKTDSIISVGCGVNGAHYSPAERHVRFGPLQLHFPPTREAIAAAERRNVENDARAAAAKARKHYEVGQRTPEGKLIIYVFKETCADIPEILKTDYGLMVDHSTSPRQMLYTLADQRTGRIQYFFMLTDAQKAIELLPKGGTFAHYDQCTIPMAYGFTEHTEHLLSTARRHGLKVLPDHVRVCTCVGMEGCK